MAVTANNVVVIPLGEGWEAYIGTLAFDSSYPTGGEAIDITVVNERIEHLQASGSGYVFEWDKANQKCLVYRQKDPAAAGGADIPLPQVANTADLSALTAVPFFAVGR